MKIVEFIKTIQFLQRMRKRNDNLDIDDQLWEEMTMIRINFRNDYLSTRELRKVYKKQYELACRLLEVDSYEILNY